MSIIPRLVWNLNVTSTALESRFFCGVRGVASGVVAARTLPAVTVCCRLPKIVRVASNAHYDIFLMAI